MGFIYTAATPPGRARRGTADSRTHEGHSKQGMAATASSWKVSANTPAMRAALCAVPCRVLLLTHPCWRVLMSEARRKQVGLRLVMGRCRLLEYCSTDQATARRRTCRSICLRALLSDGLLLVVMVCPASLRQMRCLDCRWMENPWRDIIRRSSFCGDMASVAFAPVSYSIGQQDRGSVTKLQKAIGSAVGAEMAA